MKHSENLGQTLKELIQSRFTDVFVNEDSGLCYHITSYTGVGNTLSFLAKYDNGRTMAIGTSSFRDRLATSDETRAYRERLSIVEEKIQRSSR